MQSLRAARRATQRMMGVLQKERSHDMSRAETSRPRRNLERAASQARLSELVSDCGWLDTKLESVNENENECFMGLSAVGAAPALQAGCAGATPDLSTIE